MKDIEAIWHPIIESIVKEEFEMAFCNLPAGQTAALMFILAIENNAQASSKIKALITAKDWKSLALVASFGTPDGVASPTIDDFTTVGNMRPGLQNAYFILAIADAKSEGDGKQHLQDALNTHCWDKVASTIVSSISTTGVTFTGQDLHDAYAPTDNSPCQGGDSIPALAALIGAGMVVGDFFSKTLPDFFTNDFNNFFTGTVANFFTGDFANFFKSLGDNIQNGFEDMTNALKDAFGHLDPTSW
ncbi:hypothetical protein FNU76_23470 [Chitinimonas arctica]|uniref:Uncharacterized protein n=1 Tax=Chitinimonas arctica TaxID=2594795 RepID=A0A516SLR2_9NEIS|nr:hypothetical protein [Chitinimonas arctica]QDQ29070.1 hypothetical protein FNU76_23470 [Chitinimonas arctica]